MSRSRKEPEEESGGYSWMDTYGDLVTLLLCFFVLLYSFSSIDSKKQQELVGAFSGSTAVSTELMDVKNVRQKEIQIEGVENDKTDISKEDSTNAEKENQEMFDLLYSKIKAYIEENKLTALLTVQREDNVILVSFKDTILFTSGEADLLDGSKPVLDHVINVISENIDAVAMVRIEGHTDNVPIHNARFDSNWSLSMARASSALQYFIDSKKIGMDKLSAVAYGEYQPIADNDTEEGRAANRRVDFVIEKADAKADINVG